MPWKNGGGTTRELAVEPPGASLQGGFLWRLSAATLEVSGPFSTFPGCDRWLLLLEGAGFSLDFGPQGRLEVTEPWVPSRFRGDWPAVATLVDGPCTDLGLIVDARRIQAEVASGPLKLPASLALSPGTTLLFVARGTLVVPAWGLHLGQDHLLRVDGGGPALELVPGYGGAWLVSVALQNRRPEAT